MTSGERMARMLAGEGVEVVFGIIDGTYWGLYGHLRDHGIRLVSPRHETCAVHMAGAYARLTGRLGVCLASNGPGAANALPGVAVEEGEGNRVLLITSWRRAPIVDPDRGGTYQYFDQVAVMRPMSKWSGAAESAERVPEQFRRALRHAWSGRPGVVHLAVPEDVMNTEVDVPDDEVPARRSRRHAPLHPDPALVARAADLLASAEAPLIHAGSGVLWARATDELAAVAELLAAPVTTSWGGRDTVDERSPASLPLWAGATVDAARNDADVVLALGTRFGETDWWGKPPYWRNAREQRLIHVDVDDASLGLNKPTDLAVAADAKVFLGLLVDELKNRDQSAVLPHRQERLAAAAARRAAERAELDAALDTGDDEPVRSAGVAPLCQEVFPDDAICVLDGGNAAVWGNLFHEVRTPHTLLGTYKFGMLGAGLPQALAAKLAHPDRAVYCITGDGAFGFHPQEIETAVRERLPVVVLVLADGQWGMVKVNQEFAIDADTLLTEGALPAERTINADFGATRFDLLAESLGAFGARATTLTELRGALERAMASGRPAVIQVEVDPKAHKFAPMLLRFREMHLEPAG